MRTWSAVLASAFLCALATEASAQNMDEMMRRMQQMMQQSQAVRAAEREWANLPSDERACLTRKLEEQGDTISALTRRGILPSEARFAEMRAQCAATKAETPAAKEPVATAPKEPVATAPKEPAAAAPKAPAAAPKPSAAAPSKEPATRSPTDPAAVKEPTAAPKEPASTPKEATTAKPGREPAEDEEKQSPAELRETMKKLRSELSVSDSLIAELEKAKDTAERSLKQAELARADAQSGRREVEHARASDKVELQAAIAQLLSEKANAEAEGARRERVAYAGMIGLLTLTLGMAAALVMSRHKTSALQQQLAKQQAPEPQSPAMSFAQAQASRQAETHAASDASRHGAELAPQK